MILSKGQKAALDQLESIASLIEIGSLHKLPVRPRTNTLICASSGMGKSFLASTLASRLKLPILIINACNWIPVGARGENYSWDVIVEFVQRNPKGILFLDEIDKIASPTHDWMNSVRLEIHDLLDSVVPQSVGVETEVQEDDCLWDFDRSEKEPPKNLLPDRAQVQFRLKYQYLIVGGGAWQELWNQLGTTSVGFKSEPDHLAEPNRKLLGSSMTHELLSRFRDDVVMIPQMTSEDYRSLAKEVASSLPADLREVFAECCREHFDDAIEHKTGMRFFEEMITKSFVWIYSQETANDKTQKEPLKMERH